MSKMQNQQMGITKAMRKSKYSILLLSICSVGSLLLSSGGLFAATTAAQDLQAQGNTTPQVLKAQDTTAAQDTIRLLCIGNSFSWDAVEQELAPLAQAAEQPILIGNLYYGGCSLLQHRTFLEKDTAAYGYRLIVNGIRQVQEGVTLREALRERQWDYISFQQASGDSGDRTTYEPYLSQLIDTVRAYRPHARLCWLMTWAYAADSKHPDFPRYHCNQAEMYDSICRTTQWVLQQHPDLLLVPCGVAVQNARKRLGDTLCRDGYHLNYQYGRYTASCVWLEVLLQDAHATAGRTKAGRKTHSTCVGVPYRNPEMTRSQQRTTQQAAHRACRQHGVPQCK